MSAFSRRCVKQLKAAVHAVLDTLAAPLAQKQILQETYVLQLMQQPRYQDPKRLMRYENQVFSRHGQDGIIDEIFRRVGVDSKVFVEIGCGDGLENNTTNLLRSGWRGFWFDGSKARIAAVPDQFAEPLRQGTLKARQAFFEAENVVAILESAGVPREFDLLSLDIDRNTYYVWEAMAAYRPRVAVIEYNAKALPSRDWKVDYDRRKSWNLTNYFWRESESAGAAREENGLRPRRVRPDGRGCVLCAEGSRPGPVRGAVHGGESLRAAALFPGAKSGASECVYGLTGDERVPSRLSARASAGAGLRPRAGGGIVHPLRRARRAKREQGRDLRAATLRAAQYFAEDAGASDAGLEPARGMEIIGGATSAAARTA